MFSKIFLMAVFIAIFLLMAVIGRQRICLSILLALFGGMLVFMMIQVMSPIDAGIVHGGLILAGGAILHRPHLQAGIEQAESGVNQIQAMNLGLLPRIFCFFEITPKL